MVFQVEATKVPVRYSPMGAKITVVLIGDALVIRRIEFVQSWG